MGLVELRECPLCGGEADYRLSVESGAQRFQVDQIFCKRCGLTLRRKPAVSSGNWAPGQGSVHFGGGAGGGGTVQVGSGGGAPGRNTSAIGLGTGMATATVVFGGGGGGVGMNWAGSHPSAGEPLSKEEVEMSLVERWNTRHRGSAVATILRMPELATVKGDVGA